MPDVKIVIDRASKLFLEGTVVAFRNVDLQIKTQEVLCVVGPSGCGKTTLLRCIGGLLPLNSGRILIDDQPVSSPREGIAIVFQHFGLLPWKTVAENVAFGLQIAGHHASSSKSEPTVTSSSSALRTSKLNILTNSAAACSNASVWRAPSRSTRTFY